MANALAIAMPGAAMLGLIRFGSPLPSSWQAEQIDRLTPTEHARLARIQRPLRRDQFLVGHSVLRRLLNSARFDDVTIDVETDGRLRLAASTPAYASIAHSADAGAVIVAREPVGVDIESIRTLRDARAAAALMGMPATAANDSASVLRAWVAAEARLKAGRRALADVWYAVWEGCHLAAAGVATPPLTGVFDLITGTYNPVELQWEAV